MPTEDPHSAQSTPPKAPPSPARQAFERGDFARARELLGEPPTGATPDVDADVRGATSVDPVHAIVIVLCALATMAVVLHYGG